jgi:hypothetical protein
MVASLALFHPVMPAGTQFVSIATAPIGKAALPPYWQPTQIKPGCSVWLNIEEPHNGLPFTTMGPHVRQPV